MTNLGKELMMCSKLTQYNDTKSYREAAMVTVRFSVGQNQLSDSEIPWLGHVRDDNSRISEMQRVVVPGITGMEHHTRGFSFSEPVSFVGYVREILVRGRNIQGLYLLTEDIKTKHGPDRVPVLADGRNTWRDVIDKVWPIEEGAS